MVLRILVVSLSATLRGSSESGVVDMGSANHRSVVDHGSTVRGAAEAQAPDVAELLRCLIQDLGCKAPAGGHLACHAAQELGMLEEPSEDVLRALEEAVVSALRPHCVRREAARASRQSQKPPALRRMTALVRRRWEWEASALEMELLQLLSKQLKTASA